MRMKCMLCVGLLAVAVFAALLVGGFVEFHTAGLAVLANVAAPAYDLVALRQARAAAYEALVALKPAETEEEQGAFNEAVIKVEDLDRSIGNAERVQKLKAASAKGAPSPDPENPEQAVGFMSKYRQLPASFHVVQPGRALSMAQNAALGDMLFACVRAAQGRAHDPLLIEASLGSNETVSEDGGFLVEKDVADGLLRRTFAVSRIGSKVRRIPISAKSNGLKINALKDDNRATGARWGGLQTYWIGEGDALTPQRPKFRQLNLQLKKLAGLMYATSEMLADSMALGGVIAEAFPDEFSFMVDDAIFEGSGAAQPLGFMNANCKVTVAKEAGQAAKTIQFENITNMWARCPARSMTTAEWWINQDCFPALQSMNQVIGTGGVPVYLPPGGLSASPFGTLMGRPVIPIEYCNTLGTEGDIVLADPANYVMIDKGDIQYATSIHVAFLTDEQAFRFIYRVDGQPVDDKPITPFKGVNKQSIFVTLATR